MCESTVLHGGMHFDAEAPRLAHGDIAGHLPLPRLLQSAPYGSESHWCGIPYGFVYCRDAEHTFPTHYSTSLTTRRDSGSPTRTSPTDMKKGQASPVRRPGSRSWRNAGWDCIPFVVVRPREDLSSLLHRTLAGLGHLISVSRDVWQCVPVCV